MGKAKFSLMSKTLDPTIINGKMSAFGRVPYSLEVRCSKPIDMKRYGTVKVDGKEISKGLTFESDIIVKIYGLMLPVGEVARDFGGTYTLELTGFTATDGTPIANAKLTFSTAAKRTKDPAYQAHDEIALNAAREGMVLLQNDNHVLPLPENAVLNCFGAGFYMYRVSATGAGLINPRWQPDLFDAVQEHSHFTVNRETAELYSNLKNTVPCKSILENARQKSDTAILFITRDSGEFLDNKPAKGWYYLTDEERGMIRSVTEAFPHTVAILNTGYPIEMGWIKEYGIDSVLYTGFAGMLSSYALMEILDGRTCPSGKLPDTFALDYYDYPSAKNFINFKAEDPLPGEKEYGVHLYYEEDIYMGYRYFDTFHKPVAYGFGHGLSYTSFHFSDTAPAMDEKNSKNIRITTVVTNTGKVSGKQTVQVYGSAPSGRLEKPQRILVGFEKTRELKPGEQQTLHIYVNMDDLASFDEEKSAYILEPGNYKLYLGDELASAKEICNIPVDAETVVRKVLSMARPVENFHKMTQADPTIQGLSKTVPLEKRITIPAVRPQWNPQPLKRGKAGRITFPELLKDNRLLDDFVAQMSDSELCLMNVCGGANWYMPWQNGAAGKTAVIRRYKMPMMTVSDGNTGLNIKKPNIGFPSSATVCASFNKELARQIGRTIGEESREHGIQLNLGPAMNLHRNILNGRHPEYFSEDPYLAGTMAGYHGKGLEEAGVGSCYKHLFCNNSDTSRKASQSIVSERALRELYFRVFEVALRVNMPSAVMTSYNSINGIYPAENADILQTLLRKEWGFTGFIMTDWGTYDTVDAVEMAKAGNSWLTEGSKKYVKELEAAVKDGRLSRAALEHNVRYLIRTMCRLFQK
ncbi:MAG: glycoside hydrolase family 3 C-terminal domain-containing protein [Eubacterium sp.]|nr:glycoside hydrolase family 3 C-terminal domain-containing protein [Eubacterium sp.]MCM1304846.1 glycoside hydrolase family 3 C-terminal domain-containing protein [Butyrivibrio sp.]MCM1411766.1 glycoside hydrolase family 3 C-terminal domain-containing protein [Lachnospiraceae bacterium]